MRLALATPRGGMGACRPLGGPAQLGATIAVATRAARLGVAAGDHARLIPFRLLL